MRSTRSTVHSLALSLALGLHLALPAQAACGWSLFPTANPEPSGNQLVGVSGTAANDVWEVGAAFHATRSFGYALHWDGTRWTSFAESDRSGHGGQFSGVAAIAKNDVWAIGQVYAAPNYGARRAIAEHWDGARFSVAALPPVLQQNTFLYGVVATASNDVWSVGGSLAAGGLQQPYVVHWDGNAWTQSVVPAVPNAATNLDAVTGTGASDVWAVGGSQVTATSPFRTLAEHWDGSHWSIVSTPNVNANSNVFNAVVAVAPNDVWAIGDYYDGEAFSPLAEHWDGTAWSVVPTPNSGSRTAFLLGATALGPNEVWAVGEIAKSHGGVRSYILRWNGSRWTEVPSPNVPNRLVTLLNGAAAIPGGAVWAVGGDANSKIVIHTVTEVRPCSKEPSTEHR